MTKTMLRDYVERCAMRVVLLGVLLSILLFLASLVFIYVGDEYVSPAWNEHSVPAPQTY